MMKFLIRTVSVALILAACLCSPGSGLYAIDLGVMSVTDNIVFPVATVDTLGRITLPDSFQVLVNHEDAADNSVDYTANGDRAVGWMMSVQPFGGTADSVWWFRDAVADIDAGNGHGVYTGVVHAWAQGEQFPTYFSFYVADTNAAGLVGPVTANLDAAITTRSTLTSSDNIGINWGDITNQSSSASLTSTVIGNITGTVTVGAVTSGAINTGDIAAGALREIADTLLNSPTDDMAWAPGSFANLLRNDSALAREFDDSLDTQSWAATGALGGGAIPCTAFVVAISGLDTTALQGVDLRVYNNDETATAALGTTDANGRSVFSLDADTFHVYAYQSGYTYAPLPDTLIVTAGGVTDTIRATPWTPGSPAVADLCRVYGWISDLSSGAVSKAEIRTRIVESPLRFQSTVISPYEVATISDSTGYWFVDLFPSGDLTPDTTRYEFEIRYQSGAILRRRVSVPDSTQWFFTW